MALTHSLGDRPTLGHLASASDGKTPVAGTPFVGLGPPDDPSWNFLSGASLLGQMGHTA